MRTRCAARFARAAADIQDPAQARQRLLQRDYRPGSGHRRLAAGITATAAAAGVVLGLGLTGAFGASAVSGTSAIRTTAFTLVKHANGTVTLTIHPGMLLDPSALQSDLQRDGIPAKVTTGSFCSSDPAPAAPPGRDVLPAFQGDSGQRQVDDPTVTTSNPATMPAGTELSVGAFQVSNGDDTALALISANS